MCLIESKIKGLSGFNWEGDVIIQDETVPSSRDVTGHEGVQYDIDIREFLVTDKNSVMNNTIEQIKKTYIRDKEQISHFESRQPGSFDFRAAVLSGWVWRNIAYTRKKSKDPWLFPDETLSVKEGDCEDISFLLASILAASGISEYNIRVALGRIVLSQFNNKKDITFDHVWVMYKTELGKWVLLEPMMTLKRKKNEITEPYNSQTIKYTDIKKVKYKPYFVFNDRHLWGIGDNTTAGSYGKFIKKRFDWKKFDPKFAGEVHKHIMTDVFDSVDGNIISPEDKRNIQDKINLKFSAAVTISIPLAGKVRIGATVEDIDKDYEHYHPFDHFDNGYIDEGWSRVKDNLQKFRKNNSDIDSFAKAAHAIADFYSHSSYAHYAVLNNVQDIYNPAAPPNFIGAIQYDNTQGFDMNDKSFSRNRNCKEPAANIINNYRGALISGRYAQKGDSGLMEVYDAMLKGVSLEKVAGLYVEGQSKIPSKLENAPDFKFRRGLPHHNEIAVDDKEKPDTHVLYKSKAEFERQYKERYRLAVSHIKAVLEKNWKPADPDTEPELA